MNIRTPFINDHGRLRSGWRLIIFTAIFVAMIIASDLLLFRLNLRGLRYGGYLLEFTRRSLLVICAVVAGYICNRLLEGLPWRALGLTFHRRWFWDFFFGSLVGIVTLSFAVAIAVAGQGLQFSINRGDVVFAVLKSLVGTGVLFVVAALAEEAMFRGYPLQTLSRAHLVALGVFFTSVPFGIVHLWNPNVIRGVTFVNTALAGVWLAIAYLRTRSLWFPLGIHWAWNWALGSIFGLPVSGANLTSHTPLVARDIGPTWLTGGSYGIEGGVACTIVLIIGSWFLWKTRLVSATPELLKLTSEELPASPVLTSSTHNEQLAER